MAPKKLEPMVNPLAATAPRDAIPEPKADDPVKARGIGLRKSEWDELIDIAGELDMNVHQLSMWILRDFIKRWKAGAIPVKVKQSKTLPG